MRVLSYDPREDEFFVEATRDEFLRLSAEYEIDMRGAGNDAGEVIEAYQAFQKEQKDSDSEKRCYQRYVQELYGIDHMPDICLAVKRDLSDIAVELYDFPFGHMWNGYSPWIKIETAVIHDLTDLAALECVEKRPIPEDSVAPSGKNVPELANPTIEDLLRYTVGKMSGTYNLLWSRKELTAQKLGAFCEYYAKMTLISYGISVYSSEIDDHGIDFVAETRKGFLKFQVKGVRSSSQYVFMRKEYFNIEDDAMFLFLLLLTDGEHPDIYIIPASAWRQESTVFVSHDYEGKKSRPEYGVNISKKNMPELEKYRIGNMLSLSE